MNISFGDLRREIEKVDSDLLVTLGKNEKLLADEGLIKTKVINRQLAFEIDSVDDFISTLVELNDKWKA